MVYMYGIKENILDNIKKERNMDLEYIIGILKHIMKVSGKMVYNKVKEN